MNICGLEKTTLLDFPEKVACTVFVGGCDFRCPYCYNPELVLCPSHASRISEEELFAFLGGRRSVLDGVVVCGGEPTLQDDLEQFLERVKGLGLLAKLDTNGSRPKVLNRLLEKELVDFVALDVKAPLDLRYGSAAGVTSSGEETRRSIKILVQRGVCFELRTTVVPTLHEKDDLVDLAAQLASLTALSPPAKWVLQQFRPGKCVDPDFDKISPYNPAVLKEILAAVRKHVPTAELRGV